MDNPEKLETLCTQDEDKQKNKNKNKTHKTENKNHEQHGSHQNPRLNPGTREGQPALDSHNTHAMLFI